MNRTEYIERPCATALNQVRGMPFRWSLNPYRGCVHGCHYCYARATHPYLGFNADDEFVTRIVVKPNMPDILRRELGKPSWPRERVAIGTATDAYQPCEGRYRLTRRCLEALRDFATPVSIVTKSTLVLRDRDLLAELAHGPGAVVYFTITTLDPALGRLIEPGTPPPRQRLEIMRRLSEAGIPVGVFLAPILPGITDSAASIEAVAAAAREHGATTFWASPLRLMPLVKEHYLDFVAQTFSDLAPRYERAFPGTNAPAAYRASLEERIAAARQRVGFGDGEEETVQGSPGGPREPSPDEPVGGQLRLPLPMACQPAR